MTRQLTSAVRHKLLRSPHAKRPPHGRLGSSRLIGNWPKGTAQFSRLNGAALQHSEKFGAVSVLVCLHYVPQNITLTAEQQSKVKNYFDFRITEAVSTLVAAENATVNWMAPRCPWGYRANWQGWVQ